MEKTRITKVELIIFKGEVKDLELDFTGFNWVYNKGSVINVLNYIFRIHTNIGIIGEYYDELLPGSPEQRFTEVADYLIGKDPFQREKIYNDLKRGLRHSDRTGIHYVDVALWDFAGKTFNVPIYKLLGGYKETIPAYASTYHGDRNGGLSTPKDYANFAEQCYELGYRAFKMHGWAEPLIKEEVDTVLALRDRVGDKMDLMMDPACQYETWADALRIGKACDLSNFFWLEDPYKDGGVSIFAHRKLRQLIKTPLLLTEHIFGLEQHVDFIVNGGTDFVRAGVYEDGGITGVMKIAHAAEGFGLDVELHGGGPAHRHCIASIRNTNYYELGLVHPKVKNTQQIYSNKEFNDDLESVDKNGNVAVPQGPGLGVEFNWTYIKHHHVNTIKRE